MPSKTLNRTVLALALTAAMPLAQAEIIFFENFDSSVGWSAWSAATTESDSPTDGSSTGASKRSRTVTAAPTIKETIRVDNDTASLTAQPFSVTSRNWDIHDGSRNVQVSGYRAGQFIDTSAPVVQTTNSNMAGNMLGHVDDGWSGTDLPNGNEDNYFQLDGIKLDLDMRSMQLTFDFDAALYSDGDGFAVAYSIDGINFDILNPAASSAMQYTNLSTAATAEGKSLNYLVGESTSTSATVRGFNANQGQFANSASGGYANHLAGTAIFDLANTLAGQTISLRFAYASNSSNNGSGFGINIDNIKVAGTCVNGGSGAGCDTPPPNTGVPEPASLALALLGLTAVTRRQLRRR